MRTGFEVPTAEASDHKAGMGGLRHRQIADELPQDIFARLRGCGPASIRSPSSSPKFREITTQREIRREIPTTKLPRQGTAVTIPQP